MSAEVLKRFSDVDFGLEDKDIAERYVEYTDKLYEGIGQNGYHGNAIVENCKKIVKFYLKSVDKGLYP